MPINLFSRDTQYDVGFEPSDAAIDLWQSPDIVPRNAQAADPVSGGLFDDIPHVDEIRQGQDNFVYTRIRSMDATGMATNVRAKLWWSEPGTLAVPGSWTQIAATVNVVGSSGSVIDASEFPRVAEFMWSSASLPPLGHYCLVSSIYSDDDPEDAVTDVPLFGFSEWVRYKNNVAWRNVNVVAAAPSPPPPPVSGPKKPSPSAYYFFRVWAHTPSGEEDALMRLAVQSRLPRGSFVEMEGTKDFLERINPLRLNRRLVTAVHPEIAGAFAGTSKPSLRGTLGKFTRFESTSSPLTHRMPISAERVVALTPTMFQAGKHEKVALNIWVPKAAMQKDIPLVLTQSLHNRVIGGLTWKLARPGQ